MKYIIGSFIISFAILFVAIVLFIALDVPIAEKVMKYIGLAWVVLAAASYPLAKKIVRA